MLIVATSLHPNASVTVTVYVPEFAGEVLKINATNPAFRAYEAGQISAMDFRNAVRNTLHVQAGDAEIDHCWNAMLLGIPDRKLDMLLRLKKYFTTIALSNTNSIHLSYINEVILKGQRLDDYFHHAHYSHDLGLRKPDPTTSRASGARGS